MAADKNYQPAPKRGKKGLVGGKLVEREDEKNQEKHFGNAENRTWGCWVRSKHAASVLPTWCQLFVMNLMAGMFLSEPVVTSDRWSLPATTLSTSLTTLRRTPRRPTWSLTCPTLTVHQSLKSKFLLLEIRPVVLRNSSLVIFV